jgi:hypothetical protein
MSRGAPAATVSLGQKAQSNAHEKLTPSVAMLMGSTPDLRTPDPCAAHVSACAGVI